MSVWNSSRIFAPSLICLDLCRLEEQVQRLEAAGVELLHVDVLDGHFSPSMPLGLETVRQLRARTRMAFDVHLMVTEPDYFVEELLDIGIQQLTLHAETTPHLDYMLSRIHDSGVRAGVALKPATALTALEWVLEHCDNVLLMLINPGYASRPGERQLPCAEAKITALRRMISQRALRTKITVDGRISADNIRAWGNGLADSFVLGSTCLNREDLPGSIAALQGLESEGPL